MSGFTHCSRCKKDMQEHPIYKIKVVRDDGLLMLDNIVKDLCYDEEAQTAAFLVAATIQREGKFRAGVEISKLTPDTKLKSGIILPH